MKLNRNQIKILLMAFMTLDHIAYSFLPFTTDLYQLFRFFGRMVAPIMCYMLVEGYHLTSSRASYLKRMLLFAGVSYVPYVLMMNSSIMLDMSEILQPDFNMLFTLSLCLLLLMALEQLEHSSLTVKLAVTSLFCVLSLPCDWFVFAPCYVAAFYLFRHHKLFRDTLTLLISLAQIAYSYYSVNLFIADALLAARYCWFSLGGLLIMFIESFYNHQQGRRQLKYLFYLYYPLHIAVIDIVKYIMMIR